MPRRGIIAKRDVLPDPIYNSKVVTKLINNVMLDGKKTVAQNIVYDAFEIIKEKEQKDPLEVFEAALENVMPVLEVKARRIGGATYQVPIEIRPERRQTLGLRWLVIYARNRHEKTMARKLAAEIIDAVAGNGGLGEVNGTIQNDSRGSSCDGDVLIDSHVADGDSVQGVGLGVLGALSGGEVSRERSGSGDDEVLGGLLGESNVGGGHAGGSVDLQLGGLTGDVLDVDSGPGRAIGSSLVGVLNGDGGSILDGDGSLQVESGVLGSVDGDGGVGDDGTVLQDHSGGVGVVEVDGRLVGGGQDDSLDGVALVEVDSGVVDVHVGLALGFAVGVVPAGET